MASLLTDAKRIVVKVGSALVTNEGRGVDIKAIELWARQISELRRMGREVVLVSSGAIVEGMKRLGWTERPSRVCELQAAAAVGQMGIVQAYEEHFARHGIGTAQILLTHANLADREQYLNARMTLIELLSLGVVPVINENDTVVTEEIKVGDNDTLGALVTNLIEADVLVILTDQRGLYTADPRSNPEAKFVSDAVAGDPALEAMAGGAASKLSKGGMITKILAAKRAARSGAGTIIASGREENVLVRLATGEQIGTHLKPAASVLHARKQWIADHLRSSGKLVLDAGAVRALRDGHTSLLPVGVRSVEGEFVRGECVSCIDDEGREVARGLVSYSSDDAKRICRAHTEDIVRILGACDTPEMIHRDNLVVL
ncbi:glutamate 5-kinase [Sutterella sp.]|uniref:glutamate 5-kinase n=1 Tax=Sutterella sp. TaxID=1981025 RepID=UPI0026E0D24E|nr:glutamate 5-kinase [Sutterella sp.]MDO5530815.1 glutamate 5-kinase [Sutterella sp.]